MTTGRYDTKKVAFRIVIEGTYDVDYEVGAETPVEVFRHMPDAMGPTRAVEMVVQFGDVETFHFGTDDSRNYPEKLGGYLMPEPAQILICGCGKTFIEGTTCRCGSEVPDDAHR